MDRKSMGNKASVSAGKEEPILLEKLICDSCGVELELISLQFEYLGRAFRHDVPRCPVCGQVSLPEELVTGRMASVEAMIEKK